MQDREGYLIRIENIFEPVVRKLPLKVIFINCYYIHFIGPN